MNYLKTYERRTKSFRQDCKDNADPLFYHIIVYGCFIYKEHSTRSAAASAAKLKGVTTSDILKVADWSRETTFTRFYYRPLDNVAVGINLLSQN